MRREWQVRRVLSLSLAYATGAQMVPAMRLRLTPSEVSCD